jgi:nifR3 family TIM-barrel protein
MVEKVNFWQHLPSPSCLLAPMEDVTDTVFRTIVMSVAVPNKLHVLFTEFVSSDGLCHAKGRNHVKHRLQVNSAEQVWLDRLGIQLVAQIWGSDAAKLAQAAHIISNEYDFDGIDINMGCPVKKIVKQGGCSALIGVPQLALEIVEAVKAATHLPVSVKTRTGLQKHDTVNWMRQLMLASPAAITLHCRCQADMSERPADWNQMTLAVKLRDELGYSMKLMGNGDIVDLEHAHRFVAQTGADGVMIGRGIFQNPWMFGDDHFCPSPAQRIELMRRHAVMFHNTWEGQKNFSILRRFFKIYSSSFTNAAHIKAELMETHSIEEMQQVLEKFSFGD